MVLRLSQIMSYAMLLSPVLLISASGRTDPLNISTMVSTFILFSFLVLCRVPGQPPLDDNHKSVAFSIFLKTLQSSKPPDTDELFYCLVWLTDGFQTNSPIGTNTLNVSCVQVLQAALKGLQCCLSGGKWKFGGEEELGSILASLKVQNYDTFPIYQFIFFCFVQ